MFDDLVAKPPTGFTRSSTTNYETFITVGVVHGGRVYGMLNIDAPEVGQLGETDLKLATLLANLLAMGNALSGT